MQLERNLPVHREENIITTTIIVKTGHTNNYFYIPKTLIRFNYAE